MLTNPRPGTVEPKSQVRRPWIYPEHAVAGVSCVGLTNYKNYIYDPSNVRSLNASSSILIRVCLEALEAHERFPCTRKIKTLQKDTVVIRETKALWKPGTRPVSSENKIQSRGRTTEHYQETSPNNVA